MLVINTTAAMLIHGGIKLLPGTNTVDAKEWAKARKHKTIAKRIELGMLVEEGDTSIFEDGNEDNIVGGALTEEDKNHLLSLKPHQAIKLVAETFNMELLQAWKEVENRNQVKGALNKQFELLEAKPELRDRSQSRQIVSGAGAEEIILTAKPGPQDD